MIGQVIDHYRITEKIGQGGMGEVYKAIDVNLDRVVAVKVLTRELSNDPNLIQRFQSEAKTQAQLNHPNVTTLYNFFRHRDQLLMVMEFVEGLNLEQMVRQRGPVPFQEAVPFFQQALFGLSPAPRMGIIPRDIKPSNIIVNRQGIVKVMDFGIARVLGQSRLTRTGLQVGTLYYMSPEQIQGKEADFRSDIYALGITLFELLTGTVPFRGNTDFEVMQAHVKTPPPIPSKTHVHLPKAFDRVVLKALEKDPRNRFQTVEEFSQALAAAFQESMKSAPAQVKPTVVFTPPAGTRVQTSPGVTMQAGAPPMGATVAAQAPGATAFAPVPGTSFGTPPGATIFAPAPEPGGLDRKKIMIIGGAAGGLVLLLTISLVLYFVFRGKPEKSGESTASNSGAATQTGSSTPPVSRPATLSSGNQTGRPNLPLGTLPLGQPGSEGQGQSQPPEKEGQSQPPQTEKTPKSPSSPSLVLPPPPAPKTEPAPDNSWDVTPSQQANSGQVQQLLASAQQAFGEQRYLEPARHNVIYYTSEVLRLDASNATAANLQQQAVNIVHNQLQAMINSGDVDGATHLCQLLSQHFPNVPQYTQMLQGLQAVRQQAAAAPQAEQFLVAHDHNGSMTTFCVGYLYILPDRIRFQTMQSMDGRTDNFEARRSDIKEFKNNSFPIGGYDCFHIKLKSGKNYNFAHIDQNGADLGGDTVVEAYEDSSGGM